MGLFRRKKREEKPQAHPNFTRVMNLAIVLFVIYMLITSMGEHASTTPPEKAEEATTNILPSSVGKVDSTGETSLRLRYVEAAQIGIADALRAIGNRKLVSKLEPGDGPAIACGQTLTYRLQVLDYPDFKADPAFVSLTGKKETGRMGDLTTEKGAMLQLMASGINVGGQSEYVFPRAGLLSILGKGTPQAMSAEISGGAVARLNVIAATPPAPVSAAPATILETELGDERRLRCGAEANLRLRSWYLDGTPAMIARSDATDKTPRNTLEFQGRLGAGQFPYGVERAAESMGIGTTRMAIIPTEFLGHFPKKSTSMPAVEISDTSKMLLVEITRLDQLPSLPQPSAPEKTQGAPAEASLDKLSAPAENKPNSKEAAAPSTDDAAPTPPPSNQ